MKRIIKYTVTQNSIYPEIPQDGGVQGDRLITYIQFDITAIHSDSPYIKYRIDYTDGDGKYGSSELLSVYSTTIDGETSYYVNFNIDTDISLSGGTARLHLIQLKVDENFNAEHIYYSYPLSIYFTPSTADSADAREYADSLGGIYLATEQIYEQVKDTATEIENEMPLKLDKNQGAVNSGKLLIVGADGEVITTDKTLYDIGEETDEKIAKKQDSLVANSSIVLSARADGKCNIKVSDNIASHGDYPEFINCWADTVSYGNPTIKMNCYVNGKYKDGATNSKFRKTLTETELNNKNRQIAYLVRKDISSDDWELSFEKSTSEYCFIPICRFWCDGNGIVDFVPYGLENLKENYFDPFGARLENLSAEKSDRQSVANALVNTKSGTAVATDDVSPIEHKIKISGTPSDTVKIYGKNLCDINEYLIHPVAAARPTAEKGANSIKFINNSSFESIQFNYYIIPVNNSAFYASWDLEYSGTQNVSNSRNRYYYTDDITDLRVYADISSSKYLITNNNRLSETASGKYLVICPCIQNKNAWVKISNMQVELGGKKTDFEPYVVPVTVVLDENGNGDTDSISPNMTVIADDTVSLTYNKDLIKTIAELQNAIIALGGEIDLAEINNALTESNSKESGE